MKSFSYKKHVEEIQNIFLQIDIDASTLYNLDELNEVGKNKDTINLTKKLNSAHNIVSQPGT